MSSSKSMIGWYYYADGHFAKEYAVADEPVAVVFHQDDDGECTVLSLAGNLGRLEVPELYARRWNNEHPLPAGHWRLARRSELLNIVEELCGIYVWNGRFYFPNEHVAQLMFDIGEFISAIKQYHVGMKKGKYYMGEAVPDMKDDKPQEHNLYWLLSLDSDDGIISDESYTGQMRFHTPDDFDCLLVANVKPE